MYLEYLIQEQLCDIWYCCRIRRWSYVDELCEYVHRNM